MELLALGATTVFRFCIGFNVFDDTALLVALQPLNRARTF